jgi:excisionase family DNA binding protein
MQTVAYENEAFDKLLTVNEVARLLRVHPSTIRRWEKEGQMKSYRLGPKSSIRFKAVDISKFVDFANQPEKAPER